MVNKILSQKEKIVLLLIFLTQGLLFFTFYFREVYLYYPASNWDQIGYYNNTFHVFEMLRDMRIVDALQATPHVSVLPFLTTLSYFFFGVSKFNGIAIIFLSWIGMQWFLYRFLRKVWNPYFALAFLGLFLSTVTYMQIDGGLTDFRTDIFASAFYFIAMIAMIYSKQFTDANGFNYFIICLFIAIIARMNTVALFGGIIIVYLIYLAFQRKFAPVKWIKSLKAPAWIIGGASILYLILNLGEFLSYQIIGALQRDANLELQLYLQGLTLGVHFDFVFNALLKYHLGTLFIVLIGISILLFCLFWGISVVKKTGSEINENNTVKESINIKDALFISSLFTVIPYIIYSLWSFQSPVVQTMIVSPLIVCCALLMKIAINKFVKRPQYFAKALMSIFLIPGLLNFIAYTSVGEYPHGRRLRMYNQQINRAQNFNAFFQYANGHFKQLDMFEADILWYPKTGGDLVHMANMAYMEYGILFTYYNLLGDVNTELSEHRLFELMQRADMIIVLYPVPMHLLPPFAVHNNAEKFIQTANGRKRHT